MNKCKYCTFSQGEYDPMKMVSFLLCNMLDKVVDFNDSCKEFVREPGSDDA